MKADFVIYNAKQIATLASGGVPKCGNAMEDIGLVSQAAMAIRDGKVLEVGNSDRLLAKYPSFEKIDARGMIITPGFVDSHTHPIFVHTREDEFAMRIAGKSYVEISQAGGGIRSTIKSTRDADEDTLFALGQKRIHKMIANGCTTLEAKSGYGLSTTSELKQLKVIARLAEDLPIDIVPTFMGAHEYPIEYKDDHAGYIKILCEEMIPAVAKQGIAKFCDIFTEAHVYNIDDSRTVLSNAKENGLLLKMHADEIEAMGGAELAAELNCTSADHLGAASEQGILAMKEAGVIPVLLPATLFSLRSSRYAKARFMIENGLPVAIATDYNPGSCNCDSMAFTMSLACLNMAMSPAEALSAATINAAFALDLGKTHGSLEAGKMADFILWDIPSINFIPYHLGSSAIHSVYKKGNCIFTVGD